MTERNDVNRMLLGTLVEFPRLATDNHTDIHTRNFVAPPTLAQQLSALTPADSRGKAVRTPPQSDPVGPVGLMRLPVPKIERLSPKELSQPPDISDIESSCRRADLQAAAEHYSSGRSSQSS